MLSYRITNDQLINGKIPKKLLNSITEEGVTELDLSGCIDLTTLPENLPNTLKNINLSDSPNLTNLPKYLPSYLKAFSVLRCKNLSTLPEYLNKISELEFLSLSGCSNLKAITKLPQNTKILNLDKCSNLISLPELPVCIQILNLSGCSSLRALPRLPEGLSELYIDGCSSLKTLPNLPDDLKELDLSNCSDLEVITDLPTNLKKLTLSGCSKLTNLPDFPPNLEFLDLKGCNQLSSESINKLKALERANRNNPNFRLIWPESLLKNIEALNNIKHAYRIHHSSNPALSRREPNISDQTNYPTLYLFHRFTSENLIIRGEKEILRSAMVVSEEIKKKPEILEILDKKSINYLQACINQPVSGFAEIATIMEIAKQDDITAKIEKAKILRVQQLIKNNIRNLRNPYGNQVRSHIEAELGNAMLRKVHEKLLAETTIEQKWPGIPGNIAYEATISSFLTMDNINKISDIVKEALSDTPQSTQETINFLCEVETDLWAKLILTKEESEIDKIRIERLKEEIVEIDLSKTDLITEKYKEITKLENNIPAELLRRLKQKTQDLLTAKLNIESDEDRLLSQQLDSERDENRLLSQEGGLLSQKDESRSQIDELFSPDDQLLSSRYDQASEAFPQRPFERDSINQRRLRQNHRPQRFYGLFQRSQRSHRLEEQTNLLGDLVFLEQRTRQGQNLAENQRQDSRQNQGLHQEIHHQPIPSSSSDSDSDSCLTPQSSWGLGSWSRNLTSRNPHYLRTSIQNRERENLVILQQEAGQEHEQRARRQGQDPRQNQQSQRAIQNRLTPSSSSDSDSDYLSPQLTLAHRLPTNSRQNYSSL